MKQSGVGSSSILSNFITQYGIVFVLGTLALLPFLALALIPALRSFVKKKLFEVWTKMVWSGVVRSATFSYLNMVLYLLAFSTSSSMKLSDLLGMILYNYFLLLYPLFVLYFVAVNKEFMENEYSAARFKPIMA
mmetsp:Transcript_7683/g.11906  ORF Transcript_7683/g.11906 Transcript_7683/m.11906 type:complete len:134 (+) Transcript_7683:239-640(+)